MTKKSIGRRSDPGVFVDTSMFKALVDDSDEFHSKAAQVWSKLQSEAAHLLTSNYILDETFTLIRSKCGISIVNDFRGALTRSFTALTTVRVTVADEANAWKWFLKDWSKLSFTDCVSFAVMERLAVRRVATFDEHFRRAGFTLF